jgi:hypothetical protein
MGTGEMQIWIAMRVDQQIIVHVKTSCALLISVHHGMVHWFQPGVPLCLAHIPVRVKAMVLDFRRRIPVNLGANTLKLAKIR